MTLSLNFQELCRKCADFLDCNFKVNLQSITPAGESSSFEMTNLAPLITIWLIKLSDDTIPIFSRLWMVSLVASGSEVVPSLFQLGTTYFCPNATVGRNCYEVAKARVIVFAPGPRVALNPSVWLTICHQNHFLTPIFHCSNC